MFHTNRQSFLAELNSLLSFMQEGDRTTALSMYSKMFDDAPDEQELLSYLVSPTRQAVKLARVYDSSALSNGESADFIDEISSVHAADIIHKTVYSASAENQSASSSAQISPVPSSVPSKRRQAWKDEPFQTPAPVSGRDVDAFISGIKVNDEISKSESVMNRQTDTLSTDFPADDRSEDSVPPATVSAASDGVSAAEPVHCEKKATVTKTNVPLLILYTIFAVPVTSSIIVLVILLALSFLGLASASGYVAFLLISSAFGGFAVFADIMVVLGVSLVLAALAILFMWIFVWLLGGVIVAAVKGAISLGNRLCVREVEA